MNRLDDTFQRLKAEGQKALIAYIMAGDPSLQETEALVLAMEKSGADIIELGVPFSDPIADGPVIQKAAERALRSGTTLRKILRTVASLRSKTQVPLVLMAYYNSIYAMGEAAFCRLAVEAGVDGVIVPDMPPEEAGPLETAAVQAGLKTIFLLAPTSTPARRAMVAKRSRGFLYYVSLTGITGAKLTNLEEVRRNVTKIRQAADVPVAVGFGIATPQDAAQVAGIADGVIVGSAIVRQVGEHAHDSGLPERVGQFVRSLKAAMAALPAA
ncbi:MAG: tryptophan synthase subunit alpha [Nitrospira sp.]|nr:tryptophan synthase subunit alpha [Nitrospira sp.]